MPKTICNRMYIVQSQNRYARYLNGRIVSVDDFETVDSEYRGPVTLYLCSDLAGREIPVSLEFDELEPVFS